MKSMFCAALLIAAFPAASLAQTTDQLINAEKTPQNVLTYGMSYSQQRFSPLTQIDRDTVKRLVPAWSYSMNNDTGEESQPLVYDGVIYITSQNKTVAVDALTGKEIWNTPIEYPADTTRVVCCGIVNRGAAIYQGKVFRTTLDAHVMALDMKTGKVIWNVKSGDAKDGIAMTGAPLQLSLLTSQVTPGRASIWLTIAASALPFMMVSPSAGRTSSVASAASPLLPSLFSTSTVAPSFWANVGATKRA